MDKNADQVLVGEIGAAQGLKGEVRLRSYTQTPADIATYGSLQDETGAREIEIERVRITPKAIVARIKGVTTREGAEALNRTKLRPAEKAKDGEWYVADLVGLTAVNADGAELGAIVGVHNFGASDIVEIAPVNGEATFLVAFTEATVPEVDIASGRITVVLPEELED